MNYANMKISFLLRRYRFTSSFQKNFIIIFQKVYVKGFFLL